MWPFARRRKPWEVALIMAEATEKARAKMRQEEAEFDEYLALPDRPQISQMMRMTEVSEPQMCHGMVDWDHWRQWRSERRCSTNDRGAGE